MNINATISMQFTEYNPFAEKCVQDLQVLQSEFQEKFDLNWYEDWFYNQATGLLTFSTGETELNFKYIEVGSYSEKSNTWQWSWSNPHTLSKVKEATSLIREFGKTHGFVKLTNGHFESDEFEAWEFTAIAAHLTNAIGVYRPVNEDQLQIFLIITEYVDNKTAENIKNKYVKCGTHEYQRISFVCKHLSLIMPVGFHEAFETYADMELSEQDDFQAWCDKCEIERQRDGGWNDRSMAFAEIRIACERCYFEMKEVNRRDSKGIL